MCKCYSCDTEHWYESYAEMVDDSELVDGDAYFEADKVVIEPSKLIPRYISDVILERMEDCLFDEVGDAAFGDAAFSPIQIDKVSLLELNELIDKFMNEKCHISAYKALNITEKTYTTK